MNDSDEFPFKRPTTSVGCLTALPGVVGRDITLNDYAQ